MLGQKNQKIAAEPQQKLQKFADNFTVSTLLAYYKALYSGFRVKIEQQSFTT